MGRAEQLAEEETMCSKYNWKGRDEGSSGGGGGGGNMEGRS